MFVEKLSRDEIAEYIEDVTLRNIEHDSFTICSITTIGKAHDKDVLRQVVVGYNYSGTIQICKAEIEDFSFEKHHNTFMLKRFGQDYLDYLVARIKDEDLSDATKQFFIEQNASRLAYIKNQAKAKQTTLLQFENSLYENESQMKHD